MTSHLRKRKRTEPNPIQENKIPEELSDSVMLLSLLAATVGSQGKEDLKIEAQSRISLAVHIILEAKERAGDIEGT